MSQYKVICAAGLQSSFYHRIEAEIQFAISPALGMPVEWRLECRKKQTVNVGQGKNSAQKMCAEKRTEMARGQRKSIEEKIAAKQELIQALLTRVESEKRELEELEQEKKRKELEAVSELIADSGLQPDEVTAILQQYLEKKAVLAS